MHLKVVCKFVEITFYIKTLSIQNQLAIVLSLLYFPKISLIIYLNRFITLQQIKHNFLRGNPYLNKKQSHHSFFRNHYHQSFSSTKRIIQQNLNQQTSTQSRNIKQEERDIIMYNNSNYHNNMGGRRVGGGRRQITSNSYTGAAPSQQTSGAASRSYGGAAAFKGGYAASSGLRRGVAAYSSQTQSRGKYIDGGSSQYAKDSKQQYAQQDYYFYGHEVEEEIMYYDEDSNHTQRQYPSSRKSYYKSGENERAQARDYGYEDLGETRAGNSSKADYGTKNSTAYAGRQSPYDDQYQHDYYGNEDGEEGLYTTYSKNSRPNDKRKTPLSNHAYQYENEQYDSHYSRSIRKNAASSNTNSRVTQQYYNAESSTSNQYYQGSYPSTETKRGAKSSQYDPQIRKNNAYISSKYQGSSQKSSRAQTSYAEDQYYEGNETENYHEYYQEDENYPSQKQDRDPDKYNENQNHHDYDEQYEKTQRVDESDMNYQSSKQQNRNYEASQQISSTQQNKRATTQQETNYSQSNSNSGPVYRPKIKIQNDQTNQNDKSEYIKNRNNYQDCEEEVEPQKKLDGIAPYTSPTHSKMPDQPHRKVFIQKNETFEASTSNKPPISNDIKDQRNNSDEWESVEESSSSLQDNSSVNEPLQLTPQQHESKLKTQVHNHHQHHQVPYESTERSAGNNDEHQTQTRYNIKYRKVEKKEKECAVSSNNEQTNQAISQSQIKTCNQQSDPQINTQGAIVQIVQQCQNPTLNSQNSSGAISNHHQQARNKSIDDDQILSDALIFQVPEPVFKVLDPSNPSYANNSQATPAVPVLTNNQNQALNQQFQNLSIQSQVSNDSSNNRGLQISNNRGASFNQRQINNYQQQQQQQNWTRGDQQWINQHEQFILPPNGQDVAKSLQLSQNVVQDNFTNQSPYSQPTSQNHHYLESNDAIIHHHSPAKMRAGADSLTRQNLAFTNPMSNLNYSNSKQMPPKLIQSPPQSIQQQIDPQNPYYMYQQQQQEFQRYQQPSLAAPEHGFNLPNVAAQSFFPRNQYQKSISPSLTPMNISANLFHPQILPGHHPLLQQSYSMGGNMQPEDQFDIQGVRLQTVNSGGLPLSHIDTQVPSNNSQNTPQSHVAMNLSAKEFVPSYKQKQEMMTQQVNYQQPSQGYPNMGYNQQTTEGNEYDNQQQYFMQQHEGMNQEGYQIINQPSHLRYPNQIQQNSNFRQAFDTHYRQEPTHYTSYHADQYASLSAQKVKGFQNDQLSSFEQFREFQDDSYRIAQNQYSNFTYQNSNNPGVTANNQATESSYDQQCLPYRNFIPSGQMMDQDNIDPSDGGHMAAANFYHPYHYPNQIPSEEGTDDLQQEKGN